MHPKAFIPMPVYRILCFCVALFIAIGIIVSPLPAGAQRDPVADEAYQYPNFPWFKPPGYDSITKFINAGLSYYNTPLKQDSSEWFYLKALAVAKRVNAKRSFPIIYLNLGSLYYSMAQNKKALLYSKLAIQANKEVNAYGIEELAYNNLATIYSSEDKYELAASYYFLALKTLEKGLTLREWSANRAGTMGSKLYSVIRLYANIGDVLHKLNQNTKATYYLDRGAAWAEFANDKEGIVCCLLNKSLVLIAQDSTEKAEEATEHALRLATITRIGWLQQAAISTLGDIYLKRNDNIRAIQYYKKALQLASPAFPRGFSGTSLALGRLYASIGREHEAEKILLDGMAMAKQLGIRRDIMEMHDLLSSIYLAKKEHEKAMYHKLQFLALNDSIVKQQREHAVYLLEIKYRTAEKDKRLAQNQALIAKQNANISKQNSWLTAITASAVLIFICSIFYHVHKNRLQAVKFRNMRQEQELKILISTLNGEEKERTRLAQELHDGIAGLLFTVKIYFESVFKKEPAVRRNDEYIDALRLLDDTIIEIRETAHNLMPSLLLNEGLPEAVRIHCKHIQRGHKLNVNFLYYGIIERFNTSLELFTFRIIQELLQNIVKHARATEVLVQLSLHSDILSVTIEDNGIGMPETEHSHNGIGLKSIQKRVQDLSGSITIHSSAAKGTSIYLELDLKEQGKLVV